MLTLGSLSFLAPWILIALLSLPLIWWLLRATPPVPSIVHFPAFMILRRIKNDEETPDRTPWWLLLLRLLLAAFIIIGLARPILNAPDIEPATGPLVMVVDNSFVAAPSWALRRTAIERAGEEARQTMRPVFIVTTAPVELGDQSNVMGPLVAEEIIAQAMQINPAPYRAARIGGDQLLAQLDEQLERYKTGPNANFKGNPDFVWLGDNLETDEKADQEFYAALKARGEVTYFEDPNAQPVVLNLAKSTIGTQRASSVSSEQGLVFSIRRLAPQGSFEGELVSYARDGRELDRSAFLFEAGDVETNANITLPLALQNDLASVRIADVNSAGAVWLADARDRRALIGLLANSQEQNAALLTGSHYIRQALAPFAAFQTGTITSLVEAEVSVIVLDDVGRLRDEDSEALSTWLDRGGVLIRFAGPNLANAALDGTPPLLPVILRRGERAFGGALTWDTPQPLGNFAPEGPFASLNVPSDVFVRQQILAQPGGETSERSWASLQDGTPLVTGRSEGNGLVVLFHITATPLWSDLPLSEIFIDMLRKLTFLSTLGPETLEETVSDKNQTRYAPLRILNGFGQFERPSPTLNGITLADQNAKPTPLNPPGLYGSNDTPLAINTITADDGFSRLSLTGLSPRPYIEQPPKRLWVLFLALALILFLADMIATLLLGGMLGAIARFKKPSIAALALLASMIGLQTFVTPIDLTLKAYAQSSDVQGSDVRGSGVNEQKPLDRAIDSKTVESVLYSRFAYVNTGDSEIDRVSDLGLTSLSQELSRRTTVSPALPVAVDLEVDDFSVYPILYWPIIPGMERMPDRVLTNVEAYMRLGGLVIFDTRDDERAIEGRETAEGATLRKILQRINIPPLEQLSRDHVLTRSYYLLSELRGRTGLRPVWVASGSNINDGVTPLIIGGRDFAGAWARNSSGRPVLPMISNRSNNGERAREMAFRSGINIAMVAFTGNYKTDQVHTKILLERLGEQ